MDRRVLGNLALSERVVISKVIHDDDHRPVRRRYVEIVPAASADELADGMRSTGV